MDQETDTAIPRDRNAENCYYSCQTVTVTAGENSDVNLNFKRAIWKYEIAIYYGYNNTHTISIQETYVKQYKRYFEKLQNNKNPNRTNRQTRLKRLCRDALPIT